MTGILPKEILSLDAKAKLSDAVAVNEALELVRAYSASESVRFVNGVLGSLIRGK